MSVRRGRANDLNLNHQGREDIRQNALFVCLPLSEEGIDIGQ